MLAENVARDALTLAPTNTEITNQPPIGATTKCDMPEVISPHQVQVILALFGDYEIEQGSIEDEKLHESLHAHHPIGKLWDNSVRHTATAEEAFQLVATDLTSSLANLAPEGIFNQDLEIDLSLNDMILEKLEQVKDKNREA